MLDTDIASYAMKGNNPAVLNRLTGIAVSDVCISVISKCELMYGVDVSPRRLQDQSRLDTLLRYVQVLDLPDEAAGYYAQIRGDLKRRGKMIGANDLLIAAHARCLELILVTNNVREFSRVSGLILENWI